MSEKFEASDVEWNYRSIQGVGEQRPIRLKESVKAATLLCKACNHRWRETRPLNTVDGIGVECPKCGERGMARPE